ncbi:winged helix-turn-helix transcriptional regulator [Nakamurella flava]|uniref:Winged helix-turn-helix transcriptional regulator n=1 Tax=Nakamurella flava TaxID=2576308 RepID=A0A4U6QFW8_9ACTN|nr:winged helix-turn-helix transcriptional regulator [Nakamurella flava]
MAALEVRVTALEAARPSGPTTALEGADPTAGDPPAGGAVSYRGDVTLHGRVAWSIELATEAILQLPETSGTAVLAGLGHPARAAMVRRLLRGPAGVTDLQQAVGSSSTGQLYHHLRTLTGCGLVEADGRGSYRVPATAVVPALTLLLAAADVAGHLGTAAPPFQG